jgi:hypothetical protein
MYLEAFSAEMTGHLRCSLNYSSKIKKCLCVETKGK